MKFNQITNNYSIILLSLLVLFLFRIPIKSEAKELEIVGCSLPPISVSPSKDTGLNTIFVVSDLNNAAIKYKTNSSGKVKISSFSNLGINFFTPLEYERIDAETISINLQDSDSGYIIEDGENIQYIWIINYANHRFNISTIQLSEDNNCDMTQLDIDGYALPIYFYTINGRQEVLSRDIFITYNSLFFDENTKQFIEQSYTKNIPSINETISITPPILCTTIFTIEGDRFLKEWNEYKTIKSNPVYPIATMVKTEALQDNLEVDSSDSSNQIKTDIDGLGGSAPVDISFIAYVSDAVIHSEWQMANDPEFEDITYRINQQDLNYTFRTDGTTFIRYIGSNADGSCESIGEVYTVTIGTSELLIPNAFSPNGDGVNDEWKISYRSLTDFKCWIFDRQGHELFSFDNPEKGWDGKYKGKTVTPGVYFYVIQATGADGKKYKKSGDINILKSYVNNSANIN